MKQRRRHGRIPHQGSRNQIQGPALTRCLGVLWRAQRGAHPPWLLSATSPDVALRLESLARRRPEPASKPLIALVRLLARQAAAEALRSDRVGRRPPPTRLGAPKVGAVDVAEAAAIGRRRR